MGMDRPMENLQIPTCIFTYPEIASVGIPEKEARIRGEIRIGRFPFRSNPKALVSEETEGLIKVVADREPIRSSEFTSSVRTRAALFRLLPA